MVKRYVERPGSQPKCSPPASAPRLLEQMRQVLRLHHYLIHTERSYVDWVVRYVRFHRMQSRAALYPAEPKIEAFLTHLAVGARRRCHASLYCRSEIADCAGAKRSRVTRLMRCERSGGGRRRWCGGGRRWRKPGVWGRPDSVSARVPTRAAAGNTASWELALQHWVVSSGRVLARVGVVTSLAPQHPTRLQGLSEAPARRSLGLSSWPHR